MVKKEKQLKSNLLYKGKVISLFVDDVLAQNEVKTIREYVKHPGGVCILAFVDNKLILEKQYRYAYDEIIYELPAGKLEGKEDIYKAATRELEEETGYLPSSLTYFGPIYPTVGYSNEVLHLFEATDLVKSHQHFDPDEYVEIEFYSINEVVNMIKENKIKDAKTISAILFYLVKHNLLK